MANLNFDNGMTENGTSAGAVAGTGSSFTTTVLPQPIINGKFVTPLAIGANAALPATDATTGNAFIPLPPNSCCSLVFGQNAAGALLMAQGPVIQTTVGLTTTVGALARDPQWPALPDNFVALAYTIVRTAPSALPWTPGTGTWTASGVSASTFQNISQLANRPQAS
jgi:hypothetical protein